MYDDPKSKISELERVLNAREDRVSNRVKRHDLQPQDIRVNQEWNNSEYAEKEEPVSVIPKSSKMSFSIKFLIGSIIFFILALLLVVYNFLGGGNVVSGDNIEVAIQAPISIAGGQTLSFEISIKNNNNVTLVGTDLGVAFPVGSREVSDTSLPAKRIQDFIGDILPGQTIKKNLSVVLFGTEKEKKDINITLEYKVTGSNSLFNKTKSVSVLLSSAPVSVVISGPTEVNTNQNVNFTAEITSNSQTTIKNLLLKVDYPFGFSFISSNPLIFSKNNLWLIGDLEPGGKRTIKISGIINGQEGEERGFTFNIGAQSPADTLSIETPFTSSFASVTIRSPFVSADTYINGVNTKESVSTAGSKIEGVIKWRNNLSYEVSNVSIIVKLSGNSLNKSSIQATEGYYKSVDNTIIFDKTTNPSLASLSPGQSGESQFTFGSFGTGSVTGSSLTNPTIILNISVNGQQVNYQAGQNSILFTDSRKVKLTSNPQLFAKALYYIGPFQNTGPIPPKAEQETTYTITWTVTNPLNNLSGAVVSAVLPPYVKWLTNVSPSREKVDYDPGTGKVTWNVGSVLAGAGTISPAREVSFQVSLLPSVNQIGSGPDIINEALLTAKDSFTLTDVTDSFSSLNTRLTNDPYFNINNEMVIQ